MSTNPPVLRVVREAFKVKFTDSQIAELAKTAAFKGQSPGEIKVSLGREDCDTGYVDACESLAESFATGEFADPVLRRGACKDACELGSLKYCECGQGGDIHPPALKIGEKAVAVGNRIILRDNPSLDKWKFIVNINRKEIVEVLAKGPSDAQVRGYTFTWYKVKFAGKEGWCTDNFLRPIKK